MKARNKKTTKPQAAPDENGLVRQAHGGALRPGPTGNPRGRPRGAKNKTGLMLKEAIIAAAESTGHFRTVFQKVGNNKRKLVFLPGPGGLSGYLEWLAMHEPKAFATLLGRVIPLQIVGAGDGPLEVVVYRSAEEVREELKRRGLPIHSIYLDQKPMREINPPTGSGGPTEGDLSCRVK